MVKEPNAGRVKTRLARDIGVVAATFFYRHAAHAVVRRLSRGTGWQCVLAVAPDAAVGSRFWPRDLVRRGQGRGDLGERMQGIMDWPGRGPILIVGTDIPGIAPGHVRAAFRALGHGDAVLGPTPDGGYWLVGLKRTAKIQQPFCNVRWSTSQAFADTARNLRGAGLAVADTLNDVDDGAAWAATRAWCGRVVLPRSR